MQARVLQCAAGAVLSLAACNTVARGIEETVTIPASLADGRQGAISFELWGFRPGRCAESVVPGGSVLCQQW
jgi:hypothetical protein